MSPFFPATLVTGWGVCPWTDTRCVHTVGIGTVENCWKAPAGSLQLHPNLRMMSVQSTTSPLCRNEVGTLQKAPKINRNALTCVREDPWKTTSPPINLQRFYREDVESEVYIPEACRNLHATKCSPSFIQMSSLIFNH